MASTNDHNGISASPNSSEEVESHHGTPATKLSPFSPDEIREDPKVIGQGIVRSKVPPAFVLTLAQSNFNSHGKVGNAAISGSQDPFISAPTLTSTTRSSNDASKLSPNASAFTPTSLVESVSSNSTSFAFEAPLSAPICGNRLSNFASLGLHPIQKVSQNGTPGKNTVLDHSNNASFSPTSLPTGSSLSSPVAIAGALKLGHFSTDIGKSRYLIISNLGQVSITKEIETFLLQNGLSIPSVVVVADLVLTSTVYVKFSDIRDADKAYSKIEQLKREWSVSRMTPSRYTVTSHQLENLNYSVSKYEGQVLVKVEFVEPLQRFDAGSMGLLIKELLEKFGDLTAYERGMIKVPVAAYRAEYCNIMAVDDALENLNGFKIGMCTLTVARYQPELEESTQRSTKIPGPLIIGQETSLDISLGSMSLIDHRGNFDPELSSPTSYSQHQYSTPGNRPFAYRKDLSGPDTPSSHGSYNHRYMGRNSDQISCWSPSFNSFSNFGLQSPVWSNYSPGTIGQERRVPSLPVNRQGYVQQQRGQGRASGRQHHEYGSGHHNVVDIDRIRLGTDVRTTIMLRNIPNKIDQAMLKDIVDETSFGKYDFMYLRIDFANNCNVGYAFINFEDPYFIIDFVNARAGHRWNRYNSDKVAEVSYATIQGRDCLVQKFRNSSVMLEHPGFRPKIFHTGTGPVAGSEEQFPGPDNPSKMRRSVENAEHVGLFAPRAGQNFRDEQRRRRSQYDRGTRLAEIEDSSGNGPHDYRNESKAFRAGVPFGTMKDLYYPGYGGSHF